MTTTSCLTQLRFSARSQIVLAFSLLSLFTGCATSSTRAGGSDVTTTSSGNSDIMRDARLLRMTDLRQFDTTLVDGMLADNNPERRARAALAVGQVKGKARYALLRKLLVDADTAVAANAAFALGVAKDTGAIIVLARAVAGAPDPVAMAAAWSLGDIGESARSVLLLALGEGIGQPIVTSTAAQRSPAVRAALITAASKLRPTPVTTLLPWLSDKDVTVVRAVAYTFGRTRASAAVRSMIALRSSSDEETREHVARLLTRQQTADSLSARAVEALDVLIADKSALVRINAVRSLATFDGDGKSAVLKALRDSDGNVRVATAEVVGPFLGTDVAAWKRAFDGDSTFPVRVTLIGAARRARLTALFADEEAWTHSADWRERAAVLRARVDTARPLKIADVAWGLSDKDGRVREAAIAATRAAVRSQPSIADSVRKLWLGMLTDRDVQTRASVIGVLRPGANVETVPAVVTAYESALADRENDARIAALALIAAVWQRDSTHFSPIIRQRIQAFRVPTDSAEISAAKSIGVLAGWRTGKTVSSERSLAEYEQLVRKYGAAGTKPLTAIIHTERGNISILLFGHDAPMTVDNFVQLARRGFYNNTQFHRVVPNFVAQDGDPRGDGTGGPGYSIRDELTREFHSRGSLAMATSGPDTAGSQYYLCHSPQPHLDGHYVVFGRMTGGYDVLDQIVQGDRINSIEIR